MYLNLYQAEMLLKEQLDRLHRQEEARAISQPWRRRYSSRRWASAALQPQVLLRRLASVVLSATA